MKKLMSFLMAVLMVLVAASCTKLLDTDDLSTGDADGTVWNGIVSDEYIDFGDKGQFEKLEAK